MQYQKNHSSILYYQELLISLSTQEKQWKLHLANLAYFCLELPIINVRNWVPEINLSVLSFWFTDKTSWWISWTWQPLWKLKISGVERQVEPNDRNRNCNIEMIEREHSSRLNWPSLSKIIRRKRSPHQQFTPSFSFSSKLRLIIFSESTNICHIINLLLQNNFDLTTPRWRHCRDFV